MSRLLSLLTLVLVGPAYGQNGDERSEWYERRLREERETHERLADREDVRVVHAHTRYGFIGFAVGTKGAWVGVELAQAPYEFGFVCGGPGREPVHVLTEDCWQTTRPGVTTAPDGSILVVTHGSPARRVDGPAVAFHVHEIPRAGPTSTTELTVPGRLGLGFGQVYDFDETCSALLIGGKDSVWIADLDDESIASLPLPGEFAAPRRDKHPRIPEVIGVSFIEKDGDEFFAACNDAGRFCVWDAATRDTVRSGTFCQEASVPLAVAFGETSIVFLDDENPGLPARELRSRLRISDFFSDRHAVVSHFEVGSVTWPHSVTWRRRGDRELFLIADDVLWVADRDAPETAETLDVSTSYPAGFGPEGEVIFLVGSVVYAWRPTPTR